MEQKHLFYRMINGMIRLLLAGVTFILLLHSIFSTSFVGRLPMADGSEQERTFNIADSPLRHLLAFIFLTILLLVGQRLFRIYRKRRTWKRDFERFDAAFWGLIMLTLAFGSAYVLMTQFYPGSDPAKVYAIAKQWRQGDFSSFGEGEYLFCYPFQSGIVLFFYLLGFIFGADNYVGLQLVNVFFLAVIYGLLAKISGLFYEVQDADRIGFGRKRRGLQTAVYLALLVWTPLAFYVTYLYGILPGMALSLSAVYFAGKYLTARRYRYIAAASLCMGLATVIKMNCLIYLIAIACFLVYDAVELFFFAEGNARGRWYVSLLFIVCMGLGVVFCTHLSNRLVERISGEKLAEGEVMLSWVVMGLQEAPLGPGGYNGYNGNVFTENEYDTERITEACLEDLSTIMTRMSENPLDEGVTFFARKTAFQWNDPTFICLDRTRGRKTQAEIPTWLKSLIEGKGSVRLSIFLNYMQTWILLGMLLYLFLRWKKGSLWELMGAVIFLGGYLFHMIWESSASYTIPYFALLIPYAVCGMAEWTAFVKCGIGRLRRQESAVEEENGAAGESSGNARAVTAKKAGQKGRTVTVVLGLAFFLLILTFTRTNLFERTIALDDNQLIDANDQFYQMGAWEKAY